MAARLALTSSPVLMGFGMVPVVSLLVGAVRVPPSQLFAACTRAGGAKARGGMGERVLQAIQRAAINSWPGAGAASKGPAEEP